MLPQPPSTTPKKEEERTRSSRPRRVDCGGESPVSPGAKAQYGPRLSPGRATPALGGGVCAAGRGECLDAVSPGTEVVAAAQEEEGEEEEGGGGVVGGGRG